MATERIGSKVIKFYLPLVAYLIFLLFPFYWMVNTVFKSDMELYNLDLNPLYIHSPTLGNIVTLFTETIFQAPYDRYDKAKSLEVIAPNTTKISGYDRQMKEITFYAGYTFKHMLFLNGNWLPLYEVAQGGDLILIKIEKSSWMTSLLKRIVSHD